MLLEFILPSNVQLNYNSFYLESGTINCEVSYFQIESQCPICKTKSNRIHSKYDRGLVDLPIAGKLSKISLKARKFFCDQVECLRKVFTERFDSEIFPYQRRMARSVNILEKLGTELGGNRGSNITEYAGIPVSPSTTLRIIRKIEVNPPLSTSGIIGIDDWAFKKGKNYGTVFVDLLPNRESTTLAEWLKKYPDITIVSRDRYGPYATGVQIGAPQAKQIADRFHLIKNLTEATKKVLQSKGKILKEAIHLCNDTVNKKQPSVENKELIEKDFTDNHLNADKQYKLEKVKELLEKNLSIQQISKVLQISRGTIIRYANLETYQLKREIKNYTNLDKYLILYNMIPIKIMLSPQLYPIMCGLLEK
jgi:transposase